MLLFAIIKINKINLATNIMESLPNYLFREAYASLPEEDVIHPAPEILSLDASAYLQNPTTDLFVPPAKSLAGRVQENNNVNNLPQVKEIQHYSIQVFPNISQKKGVGGISQDFPRAEKQPSQVSSYAENAEIKEMMNRNPTEEKKAEYDELSSSYAESDSLSEGSDEVKGSYADDNEVDEMLAKQKSQVEPSDDESDTHSSYADSEDDESDIGGAYAEAEEVKAMINKPRELKPETKHKRRSSGFDLIQKNEIGGEIVELRKKESPKEAEKARILQEMVDKYPQSKHLIDQVADLFKDPSELTQIFDYIEANKHSWFEESSQLVPGQTLYKSHKETKLSRTIQITSDQKIFIHLYKKPLDDKKTKKEKQAVLGQGNFKKVTYALDYGNMEMIAKATTKLTSEKLINEAKREESLLKKYHGQEGFVDIYAVTYQNPKPGGVSKQHIWMPVYAKTLSKLKREEQQRVFNGNEWENIIRSGLKGLQMMHAGDDAHRDVTLDNLFVEFGPKGEVAKVFFGDVGLSTKANEQLRTVNYFNVPPESFEEKFIDGKTHDLWGFGILLYFLKNNKYPPYLEKFEADKRQKAQKLVFKKEYSHYTEEEKLKKINSEALKQARLKLMKSYKDLPEPSDPASLDHLIWRMLRVDKSERIHVDEIFDLLNQKSIKVF